MIDLSKTLGLYTDQAHGQCAVTASSHRNHAHRFVKERTSYNITFMY